MEQPNADKSRYCNASAAPRAVHPPRLAHGGRRGSRDAERGWSVLELLVATALSMALATLALQGWLGGSGLQAEVRAELRLHEGARFALHVLGRQLRLAGFPGCLGATPESSPLHPDWVPLQRFDAVEGWNSARPHEQQADDVFAVWWSLAGCDAEAGDDLQAPPADSGLESWQAQRGSLFYLERRGGEPLAPSALFVRDQANFAIDRPARELVAGVTAMRLGYRLAPDAAWLAADQIENWQQVRQVRVALVLESPAAPGLRREFAQVFALRNRAGNFAPLGPELDPELDPDPERER